MRSSRAATRAFTVVLAAHLAAACTTDSPTTPSVLDTVPFTVTDLRAGTGATAADGDVLTIAYVSWLYDEAAPENKGLQIESVAEAQFVLGVAQVIAGWDDGLPGMRVGGLRRLVVPPSRAFGIAGSGPYPGNRTLLFEIELLEVEPLATDSAPFSITDLVIGGGPEAVSGSSVVVAYEGWLYKADEPDNKGLKIDQGNGLGFVLGSGQVIAGFDRAVEGMRVGGQRRAVLPPELAYGPNASDLIPANATLVFEIRLLSVG